MRDDHRRNVVWQNIATLALAFCVLPSAAVAQNEPSSLARWNWAYDANVFVGWNYQYRKFRDFETVESQNWFMGAGERAVGRGTLRMTGMASLEPFTIQGLGSPQVFQTGEMYHGGPNIDRQHPHDLVMQLGALYTRPIGRFRVSLEGDVVGSPSLGPVPFMHRPSAAENPQVPLSHHQMDSTHLTPGVVRIDIERASFAVDGSWFRGEEPDDVRTNLDIGRLDSWALRGRWVHGPWSTQVSGAHLNKPEWVEPYFDVVCLTASLAYARADGSLAAIAAWGQNQTFHGKEDGYLSEATWRPRDRSALYWRAENTTRDIFGGGRHPISFIHFHPLAKVGALTMGYLRDVWVTDRARVGIGADVTAYHTPRLFDENYGQPWSFHVFVRYRPSHRHSHH